MMMMIMFRVVITVAILVDSRKKRRRAKEWTVILVWRKSKKKDDESIACQVNVGVLYWWLFSFLLSVSNDVITLYKFIDSFSLSTLYTRRLHVI